MKWLKRDKKAQSLTDEQPDAGVSAELTAEEDIHKMSDEEYNARLTQILNEEPKGKKKKKHKKFWREWSRKRKIITAAAGVLIILIAGSNLFGGKKKVQAFVMTEPVTRGSLREVLTVNGPVEGTDSVEVVSSLHAEIIELPVKEGDPVEQDQVIATLDITDIQREVDIAQNAYDQAVANLDKQNRDAANGYAKARDDFQTASKNLERTSTLFHIGGASQVELESAQNAADEAKRQMDSYNMKDGRAVADDSYAILVETARLELEQKQKRLMDTQIKSPISGTVVRVNTKVGRFADTIDDDKPIFIIDNLDSLEMKIKVSEYSIGKVEQGQPVTISADILDGKTVNGEVTSISPTGEEKGGGSTERVIPITIRIMDDNSGLIAGITAKAEILLNEAEDTLIVSTGAVLQKDDGAYLASVDKNTVKLIPVETGVESDIQVEVRPRDGAVLEENTQVITNPDASYQDGMPVTVMPAAM